MTIQEMLQRQQEIVDLARNEGRSLTAEETAEFDGLTNNIRTARSAADNGGNENTNTTTNNGDDSEGNSSDEQRQVVLEQERSRIAEITSMCRDLGVGEDRIRNYIEQGQSLDSVRSDVITSLRSSNSPLSQGRIVTDEADKFRNAAVDGILMRGGVNISEPAPGANEFASMSLRDLAVETLSQQGENVRRKSNDEIFSTLLRSFYNPSSAFPAIMDQAINKAYIEGHKNAAVTFDKFTRKGTLTDFKKHDNYYLSGPAGEFLEVPENGELKADVPSDAKRPQRQLKTYGRQFTLTRQAFINDDIGLITRVPAKYAASARKTINKQVFKLMIDNPKIYDGTVLFSKAHGNIISTGTGITQESLRAMIMALNTQKDEFGEAIIIRPSKIVVPAGYMFDMYTLFYSPTINTTGNTQAVNPLYQYKEQIEVIEDPTINVLAGGFGNVMPWWLIGAPEDTDFIEVDYLNGQEIPTIRRSEQPGTLGFVWDIYLDWGVNVMDYRGAIKNNGVAVESPIN